MDARVAKWIGAGMLVAMPLCACELVVGSEDRVIEPTLADAGTESPTPDGASLALEASPVDEASRVDQASDASVTPPADAPPSAADASACAVCITDSAACQSTCAQTSASCRSRCTTGGCLNQCAKEAQHCDDACVKTCATCTASARCGGMVSCGGQNGNGD